LPEARGATLATLSGMRVLVTGASGFLGHAVTSALADRGHVVVALSRSRVEVPPKASQHIRADVRSSADMVDAIAQVDAVCHLAALVRVRDSLSNPLDYWRTNVGGTLNVLEALVLSATRKAPKLLILSSTGAVYGTPEHQPISEDQTTAPSNPYAATKLAADLAASHVAATGAIGAITLRAFNIAGASSGRTDHDLTRLIPKILAVQAGQAHELLINGDGSAVRDFVHVDDMADAFSNALEICRAGDWRVYNIGSGRRTTVREVVSVAEQVTGKTVPIRNAPPANEPPVLVADVSRAMKELDWLPKRSDLTRIISDAWRATELLSRPGPR
jgi:UDP-glucose 4-epimerase